MFRRAVAIRIVSCAAAGGVAACAGAPVEPGGPSAASPAPPPASAAPAPPGRPAPPAAERDPAVAAVAASVDRARFERDLRFLAKPRHHRAAPAHLREAARHVEAELGRAGFRTSRQEVRHDGAKADNVIGERPGASPDEVVVVCAHYDAVPGSPGADDNASGVAAALAVARALGPVRTRAALRVIAFAFEEQGLVGSQRYVASLDAAERARIAGVYDVEMIGYATGAPGSQRYPEGLDAFASSGALPTTGDFIGALGRFGDGGLLVALEDARAYTPELPVETLAVPAIAVAVVPDLLRSDHAPFWLAGIPAVMIGDTADLRTPHYHESSDTVETLDVGFAHRVTSWLTAGVLLRLGPAG